MPIPTSGVRTLGSILCAVGTRPNFMKTAPIMAALGNLEPRLALSLAHTGQYPERILAAFQDILHSGGKAGRTPEFRDGQAATCIAAAIHGWLENGSKR